ncbi:unnamed protein product, partial [marine sediment metagenome]
MIKSNEIQKGNLLKYKRDIIEVIAIDQYDFVWWDLKEDTVPRICDAVEIFDPIKLTEEWLIKWQLPKRERLIIGDSYYTEYSIRNEFDIYCFFDHAGNCLIYGECD